ncbi:MAG: LPP20 family lipoprotein [Bacteroidia bacterium]|nr:LPP20 family lipoprotein [Bacteroidia bacterium]
MKNRFSIIFILLATTLFSQKKPEWITNRPFSNDFFIGINFASKESSDYIDQAILKALNNLSSEIVVNIKSETFLKTTDIDNEVKQSYESNIKANVQKDLEGYEQVEVWQDKKEYWVYYRLSKSAYYSLKRQKFETALTSSTELFNKAKQDEAAGNFVQAIHSYILSTKPIEPYLAETFDAVLKNKSNEILSGAINGINTIFANLKVVPQNKKIVQKNGEKVTQTLNTKVLFSKAGKQIPVSSLPLKYITEKGTISLTANKSVTDDQGFTSTQMTDVSAPDNNASLKAIIDLEELLRENDDVLITKAVLRKASPYDMFIITIRNPTIFFIANEKNLAKKLAVNVLEPALKDYLKQNGFTFVPSKSEADFIIDITADTRKGGGAYDLSVTFLDANITLTNAKSNEQIYSKQFSSIKGVKQDHEAAGNEAYRKTINTNFKNELFPELNSKFKINP